MAKKKHEDKTEYYTLAKDAYCAVDSTKCDGACQEKFLEQGIVHCAEVINRSQALNQKERAKRR